MYVLPLKDSIYTDLSTPEKIYNQFLKVNINFWNMSNMNLP